MRRNVFNTVRKGIIRSAALLLLAGFCGNISANLDDFLNIINMDDQYATRIADMKLTDLNKVEDIRENESINPVFQDLLQMNYDLYMELNNGGELETYKERLGYFDSLMGDKAVSEYKPQDAGDVVYIKSVFQALYAQTEALQTAFNFKNDDQNRLANVELNEIIAANSKVREISNNLDKANKVLQDINEAIDGHGGISIDDKSKTDQTSANVLTVVNELTAQVDNAQQASKEATNNLNALLAWSDKDEDPNVPNLGGSALRVLVDSLYSHDDVNKITDELKSKIIDVNTLGAEDLANNPYVKNLNSLMNTVKDKMKELLSNIGNLKVQLTTANSEKEELEQAIEHLRSEYHDEFGKLESDFNVEITEKRQEIEKLNKQITVLNDTIKSNEKIIAKLNSKVELLKQDSANLISQIHQNSKDLRTTIEEDKESVNSEKTTSYNDELSESTSYVSEGEVEENNLESQPPVTTVESSFIDDDIQVLLKAADNALGKTDEEVDMSSTVSEKEKYMKELFGEYYIP